MSASLHDDPHRVIADVVGLARGMADEAGRDAVIDAIAVMTDLVRAEMLIASLTTLHNVVVGISQASKRPLDETYDSFIAAVLTRTAE